ncbi:MAG: type II toxin-antitoxin system HicA family toxin [Bacteroidia bacterium]
MPSFRTVSRRELIIALSKLGFTGPFSGGKHQFMIKGKTRLTVPNPHKGDIGINLLSKILKQAGISRKEWEKI